MRLIDIVILTVVLSVFCPLFSSDLKTIREMDLRIEELRMRKDCMRFIPESFYKICETSGLESERESEGEGAVSRWAGYANLDEWAEECRAMWKLETVDWKIEGSVICGAWSGPYGSGTVYYRRKVKNAAAKKIDSGI